MENLPIKNSSNEKLAESTLKSTTAILLIEGQFSKLASSVHYSIAELLDKTPITMLKRQLTGAQQGAIEAFLATQIQLLTESVNITSNIEPQQIPSIARQLIELFPVETLEDFVLCFRRGALSLYGPLYNRLDAGVLVEWMQKYLDEKYQLIEAQVVQAHDEAKHENEVNYEAYKQRIAEQSKPKRENNLKTNEYERQRLATPYKYYTVRGLEVMATSQTHAENIMKRLIELGEVEEVPDTTANK